MGAAACCWLPGLPKTPWNNHGSGQPLVCTEECHPRGHGSLPCWFQGSPYLFVPGSVRNLLLNMPQKLKCFSKIQRRDQTLTLAQKTRFCVGRCSSWHPQIQNIWLNMPLLKSLLSWRQKLNFLCFRTEEVSLTKDLVQDESNSEVRYLTWLCSHVGCHVGVHIVVAHRLTTIRNMFQSIIKNQSITFSII